MNKTAIKSIAIIASLFISGCAAVSYDRPTQQQQLSTTETTQRQSLKDSLFESLGFKFTYSPSDA
jgi:hypothetical protein